MLLQPTLDDLFFMCVLYISKNQKNRLSMEQCWTVGAIFTFSRSRMFGTEKLRPLAVGRSRSRRLKIKEIMCHKIFYQQLFQLNR